MQTCIRILFFFFIIIPINANFVDGRVFSSSRLRQIAQNGDGSTRTFALGVISDQDKQSALGNGTWLSVFRRGNLSLSADNTRAEVVFDFFDHRLLSRIGINGRGMELSDLVIFDNRLLTVDDRTGIIYEIKEGARIIPWLVLADGDGSDPSRRFKGEWMTVKDGALFVGSHGRLNWDKKGNPDDRMMWVKRVDKRGGVTHLSWAARYRMILASLAVHTPPGYVTHEAVQWSETQRRWFFLPRRISRTLYTSVDDSHRGAGILLSVDEHFSQPPRIVKIGRDNSAGFEGHSALGFSAFQFVPTTNEQLVIALKTLEENDDVVASFVTVFNATTGAVLLNPQPLQGTRKFEGICFL